MTTFITSDIHLSHRNIVQYCPHRVTSDFTGDVVTATYDEITYIVGEMNEKIISNWNSVVSSEDEVFCLGDFAMGKIVDAPALIRRLNGKKYLVKGNHDKTLHKLIQNNPELDDLFIWIKDVHEMGYVYNGKKLSIFMSHFPHMCWNGMNQSSIHFHGHLHGSPSNVPGRILDVGMDTNGLYPYRIDAVIEKMLKIDVIRNHH